MRALLYLYRTRFKNRLKALLKSPGQLIALVFFLGLMILSIVARELDDDPPGQYRDISELYAIIAGVYILMFVLTTSNGVKRGGTLFSMADVNLAFVSCISPAKILFYGLVQQLSASIFLGFFIIYQYTLLNITYGITVPFLFLILLGYSASLLCGQITSMLIYYFTSGSDTRKKVVKYGILALCTAAAGYVLYGGISSEAGMLDGIVKAANSLPISLFPVAGWLKSAMVGIHTGQMSLFAIGSVASLVYLGILFVLLSRTGDSYYEDVLQTSEQIFKAVIASRAGNIGESVPEKVKIGRIGIGRGHGANTFHYKHRLENRRARVFLFDLPSIIYIAVAVIFAAFMRSEGLLITFSMSTYMMIFAVAMGRWVKELVKHYIYLVPEPPFRKLIHCLRGALLKLVAEAALMYGIIYFILDLTVPELILAIVARVSFGLLFTSANIFVERFFSSISVKALAMIVYFLFMILFSVPGIVTGVLLTVFGVFSLPDTLVVLGAMAACNFVLALFITFISRNMLEYAELNTTR